GAPRWLRMLPRRCLAARQGSVRAGHRPASPQTIRPETATGVAPKDSPTFTPGRGRGPDSRLPDFTRECEPRQRDASFFPRSHFEKKGRSLDRRRPPRDFATTPGGLECDGYSPVGRPACHPRKDRPSPIPLHGVVWMLAFPRYGVSAWCFVVVVVVFGFS